MRNIHARVNFYVTSAPRWQGTDKKGEKSKGNLQNALDKKHIVVDNICKENYYAN